MSDAADLQTDALEHAHHSAHAAQSGDDLTIRVTLSIAVMAVVAAFIGALGETESSHTFVEKNDAVLAQARASDAWANYQAESLKKHIYDTASALAPAGSETAQVFHGNAERYGKEQPEIQAKAHGLEAEVEARSQAAEQHFERHHRLTIAEGIVHTAIAGASIALLARRPAIWIGSLLLTAAGIIAATAAYAF